MFIIAYAFKGQVHVFAGRVKIVVTVLWKNYLRESYYSLMFFIAYAFKEVHVFAGQVKIVSHSSYRTSAILKYFCPMTLCCTEN